MNGRHFLARIIGFALALTALVGESARATELFEIHKSARAMGMGNAFVSLVDSEEALFYNPAGIAKNGGFFWTIVDPAAGLNNLDAMTTFSDLQDQSSFTDALDNLYGKPIWGGANAKTAIMTPYFAAAFYDDLDVGIRVDNPVATELNANVINDMGIAVGTGFTAGFFQFGAVAKRIERTGARKRYGPSTIAAIAAGDEDTDVIFDDLQAKGLGYSLDFGFNFTFPSPVQPTFSFVWKNVGNTKFSATEPGHSAPPTDKEEWILGASLVTHLPLISLAPSIDIKHLEDTEEQLGKKIHMGLEVGLPLLDLRVGFHQGYLSYGAGLGLGPIQLDVASWGVELGEYPGQFEDRRYMVQATIRLGLDLGLGGGSNGSGSSDGSRGRSGLWSGRLKSRR